jgi:hypothetical protein
MSGVAAAVVGCALTNALAQGNSPALEQKLSALAGDAPGADEGVRGIPIYPADHCPGDSIFTCAGFIFAHTNSATTVASDPTFPCAFGGPRQGSGTVWARIVPVTTSITITTGYPNPTLPNGRLPDTLLAVYSGACGTLTPLACNDDIDFNAGILLSSITLNGLTSGQTYFIEVAAYSILDVASYTLSLSGCLLDNWICEGAVPIDCHQALPADLRRSSTFVNSPLFPCRFNGATRGDMPLWYRFTASTPNVRLFTSDGNPADAANDTLLAVYTGECDSLTQIACNDDRDFGAGDFFSEIVLAGLTIGRQYYVEVAAYSAGEVGEYRLHMECRCEGQCPPDAYVEQEPCGQDTNSACWNASPGFEAVELGQIICGRSGQFQMDAASGIGNVEYDIYEFVTTRTSMVYWVVRCDQRLDVASTAILTAGCTGAVLDYNTLEADPCQNLAIGRFLLDAGAYQGGFALDQIPCPSIGGHYLACATIGPACPGDADGDGDVDFADVTAVLQDFGTDYRPFPGIGPGDANFSGFVSFADVTAILQNFNTACFTFNRTPPEPVELPPDSPWAR